VILLLAGKLSLAPARYLLERLADPSEDDAYRHRLAVAAQCLPEIEESIREQLRDLRDRIATEVFATWWSYAFGDVVSWSIGSPAIEPVVSHLGAALPALVRAEACTDSNMPLLGSEESRYPRERWPPYRGPLLDVLAGWLSHFHRGVRHVARDAFRQIGVAACTEPMLSRLLQLLEHADMQTVAPDIVKHLGPGAMTEPVLSRLLQLLEHPEPSVQWAAARALRPLEPGASEISRLLQFLEHPNRDVKLVGLHVLEDLGPTMATDAVMSRLAYLLEDPDVRGVVLWTLEHLKPWPATEPVLSRLLHLLGDTDADVRAQTTEALGNIGPGATELVLSRLVELLGDYEPGVRWAAATALECLGRTAREPVLSRLRQLLEHSEPDVQRAAARVLRFLEPGATELSCFPLPAPTFDPTVQYEDPQYRTFGGLGPAVATEEGLAALPCLLEQADASVQRKAVFAVGCLGLVACTESVLPRLTRLIENGDSVAAAVVARLMRQGIRMFHVRGRWEAKSVAELSQ
jgi:HEAT repeat protein